MRLQAIDELTRSDHYYLTDDDQCYYFGSYLKGANWGYDAFHQLFWNFKKALDKGGQHYKKQAISRVGRMVAKHFAAYVDADSLFIPVPPSTAKGDPGYDDRCLQALKIAQRHSSVAVQVSDAIRQLESTTPAHLQESRPRPEDYQENYAIVDDAAIVVAKWIVVFDDLITTGAHFRAISEMVTETNPRVQITGLFLGRRKIQPEPEDDDLDAIFGI